MGSGAVGAAVVVVVAVVVAVGVAVVVVAGVVDAGADGFIFLVGGGGNGAPPPILIKAYLVLLHGLAVAHVSNFSTYPQVVHDLESLFSSQNTSISQRQ